MTNPVDIKQNTDMLFIKLNNNSCVKNLIIIFCFLAGLKLQILEEIFMQI